MLKVIGIFGLFFILLSLLTCLYFLLENRKSKSKDKYSFYYEDLKTLRQFNTLDEVKVDCIKNYKTENYRPHYHKVYIIN